MLEEYDPHLSNFVHDVGTFMSTIVETIKIALGIGYLIGSKSVGALSWTCQALIDGYSGISTFAATVRDETMEFGGSFVRAILLIFYGIQKIIDSFYITAVDIGNFCVHYKDSISRTTWQSGAFVYENVFEAFVNVPRQVVDALSIVGEATVGFFHCVTSVIYDFLLQLIISPAKVILLAGKVLATCLLLPIQFIRQMPSSSLLGLFVVVILIFACRRVIRYLVVRNILRVIVAAMAVFSNALSFIRLSRLKSVITSTVLTVAKLHDQESSSSFKAACVICQDKPVSFMSNPCKHVCLCEVCVHDLIQHDNRCPICRHRVSKYDRVFIP